MDSGDDEERHTAGPDGRLDTHMHICRGGRVQPRLDARTGATVVGGANAGQWRYVVDDTNAAGDLERSGGFRRRLAEDGLASTGLLHAPDRSWTRREGRGRC